MKKLRFAPLIRVSTERQEKQGESLNTQKKQIEQYVDQLNGTIPKRCLKYSGQEHATIGQERKNLDQLLADSGKNLFDAVIVCDASRWSRDNAKSKAGLEVLRKNNIRFFCGSSEFDLYDPQATLFLGMSTEMNEFVAMQNAKKSMDNKIALAKQNVPTSRLPYGRTYDKSTNTWAVDKSKQKIIKDCADKYIKGGNLGTIAKSHGMSRSNLWKLLNHRCGSKFSISFKSERLNIDEVVELAIPALLPDKIIEQIHKRAESNTTFNHGAIRHKYLLSRMIFCRECGRALTGAYYSGYKYYRHAVVNSKCRAFSMIRADQIEADVLMQVYWLTGDQVGFQKAIDAAIPNHDDIEKSQQRLEQIIFELKKIDTKQQRIVDLAADGLLPRNQIKPKMDKLIEQENLLKHEQETLKSKLVNVPSRKQIDKRFKAWKTMLKGEFELNNEHLLQMTFDQKRKMLQAYFSGTDSDGKRLGVDIRFDNNWHYQIRGILPQIEAGVVGVLPFGGFEYDAERKEFADTRNKLVSKFAMSGQ